ncbi:unnamed protein product [Schistosoma margrebowiei]|uniref:Uncharacterized protein n=1 Tax=Schistosoma margrebowiei TaxID=48269 RepID=A0A3P8H244_9TREM|nr:unnamed protein product [Schistosoma margrebowiei]
MKMKLKKHWKAEESALQRFDTSLFRDTDKPKGFKKPLDNRFETLHFKEKEITMGNY